MKKKSLLETNPYLRDRAKRKKMFITSALTSTAIEGVHLSIAKIKKNVPAKKRK